MAEGLETGFPRDSSGGATDGNGKKHQRWRWRWGGTVSTEGAAVTSQGSVQFPECLLGVLSSQRPWSGGRWFWFGFVWLHFGSEA